MYLGIVLIVISIIGYIVHLLIYNYYLAKNAPEVLRPELAKSWAKPKQDKKVTIVVTKKATPVWVALLGFLPLPLFLLGLLLTAGAIIIKIFS